MDRVNSARNSHKLLTKREKLLLCSTHCYFVQYNLLYEMKSNIFMKDVYTNSVTHDTYSANSILVFLVMCLLAWKYETKRMHMNIEVHA